jgi:hypothetical protein
MQHHERHASTYKPRATRSAVETFVDVLPIGAVLTICFSIGSVFYEGTSHFSAPPPPHVMKAYRKDIAVVRP